MEMKTAATAGVTRSAVQSPARGSGTGRMRGNPTLTLLTVALGVMMVALDGTIVAVANPAIQADLHASLAGIQWVTHAYLLALAVSLISIGLVIAFRVLQGVFGAMLQPTALALLRPTFPVEKLNGAI